MGEFFAAGGWGMYPTTLFGSLLVAVGIACAALPERRFVPLLASMGVVTLGSGLLGCLMGFVNVFRFAQTVPAGEQESVLLLGISESLNNVVLAFVFIVLSTLIAAVGALRLGLRSRTPAGGPVA